MKKLTITFVLPFVNLTGGIKILFEHANRLAQRGHQVTILYPGVLFHGDNFEIENYSPKWRFIVAPLRAFKYWLFVSLLHKTDARWFQFSSPVIFKRVPDLSARYAPIADIVIATAPETVPWVATYKDENGIKVHFAQDYEIWYLPIDFVDKTFSHKNMHLITIGSWQKKLYEEKFKRTVELVVPDGVDSKQFTPKKQLPHAGSVRVLMNYHHADYKAIPLGLRVIENLRKKGLEIQTVLFGVHPLKADVPQDVEYHRAISEADLPDLYRSADIFLWPTEREGFGLPPLEAMACGTPPVATATGAVSDYVEDGKTGFVVPAKDEKSLTEKLEKLITDEKLRLDMGASAARAAKEWDWEIQVDKLEKYLISLN